MKKAIKLQHKTMGHSHLCIIHSAHVPFPPKIYASGCNRKCSNRKVPMKGNGITGGLSVQQNEEGDLTM